MNVMPGIMRREETKLVPWLIGMSYWRAALGNKQSILYSPEDEVILVTSDHLSSGYFIMSARELTKCLLKAYYSLPNSDQCLCQVRIKSRRSVIYPLLGGQYRTEVKGPRGKHINLKQLSNNHLSKNNSAHSRAAVCPLSDVVPTNICSGTI